MGHRFALQERAEPTQQPSDSSGLFSTWQRGASLAARPATTPPNPHRVSWLVGWPTGVVCAEFLPEEGEAMLATPYITLSTCQGGEILLWKKTAFTHSFVSGLE